MVGNMSGTYGILIGGVNFLPKIRVAYPEFIAYSAEHPIVLKPKGSLTGIARFGDP